MPGVNELMIVEALKAAPALGVTQVSLNFAAFRSALERGEQLGAGPILRIWRRVLLFASRWFQIESLYRFNAKFQPRWQPRFLVYPTGRPASGRAGRARGRGVPHLAQARCGSVVPDDLDDLRPLARADGLPVVMGVVNVTPDSFSDGGEWFEPSAAVAHGLELLAQGADILDVGGESTRPGASRPTVEEELRRVLPVVRELTSAGAVVSIDTMRAQVAAAAL